MQLNYLNSMEIISLFDRIIQQEILSSLVLSLIKMLVRNGSLVKCTIIEKYKSCYFSEVQCSSLAVTISNSDYVKKNRMRLSNSRLNALMVKSRFVKLNIRYQITSDETINRNRIRII